jgi:hypothetical protein
MGSNPSAGANVVNILNTVLTLVDEGTTAYQLINTAHDRVKAIVDQGRDPTAEEWNALDQEISTLHQALQS